jgi:hypothetical protein
VRLDVLVIVRWASPMGGRPIGGVRLDVLSIVAAMGLADGRQADRRRWALDFLFSG